LSQAKVEKEQDCKKKNGEFNLDKLLSNFELEAKFIQKNIFAWVAICNKFPTVKYWNRYLEKPRSASLKDNAGSTVDVSLVLPFSVCNI